LKIAVLFHRFGPYHCARLAAAAKRCELTAIEVSSETGEYAWAKTSISNDYARLTLFSDRDSRTAPGREVARRVNRALFQCKPEAVAIPGWSDTSAFAALRWCTQNRVPAILMSESTVHDERRVWWKELVKRRVVRLSSSALVGGRLHAQYLQQLGMPADRIFTGYDVVDNAHFSQRASVTSPPRTGRGLGEVSNSNSTANTAHPFFLASARFIPKKNLEMLLRAYAEYRKIVSGSALRTPHSALWNLVLLGDGPLRPALNAQLNTLNLNGSVLMPGFKQYDELPAYYANAGAFVHASTTEQWGLVVNEAAAAGLPLMVSNRCGCVPELIREGVNGFTFDPENTLELASKMRAMARMDPGARRKMGEESLSLARKLDVSQFAVGLEAAARCAAGRQCRLPALWDRILLELLMRW
jgi:glycosyltransferase involved in cell wall biosynthesis